MRDALAHRRRGDYWARFKPKWTAPGAEDAPGVKGLRAELSCPTTIETGPAFSVQDPSKSASRRSRNTRLNPGQDTITLFSQDEHPPWDGWVRVERMPGSWVFRFGCGKGLFG